MGPAEWAMLVLLGLIWGGSFFFNALALRGFPPLTVVALRVAIGAICLWLIVLAMNYALPRKPVYWLRFLAMGILNNAIPFTLIVWSQQHIAAGLASILNATTPLFTVIIAHALLHDEKLSAARLAGVVIGIAGVAVMVGLDALHGLGAGVVAQVAALSASIFYALASVFGRGFSGITPMITAAGQVTGSSLIMIPLALTVEAPRLSASVPGEAWGAVIGLAVLCTAFAYCLYFSILQRAGATNIMLVTFLTPPSAILLGVLFLGETIAISEVAGMLAIGIGLALIDGRLLRSLTSQHERKE
jgi:drug/metabolite transporter (DMT)-like permease